MMDRIQNQFQLFDYLQNSDNIRQKFIIKNPQFIMMFSASSKRRQGNQNYGDPQNGETLFQFLKRKKKVALQESLTNSKLNSKVNRNQNMSVSKSFLQGDNNSYTPVNQTKRSINLQRQKNSNMNINNFNSKTKRQSVNDSYIQQSMTPKRVRFADKQNQQQRSRQKDRKSSLIHTYNQGNANRSFVELISPFKRKQDRSPTPTHESQNLQRAQNRISNQSFRNQNVKSGKQHYSRKNLNQSIKLLKDTLHKYIDTGKSMRQKAHSIFVQIKPVLKFTQQNTDQEGLYRKAEQLKLKLRTFQNMFKSFDVQNSSNTIQSFHRTLSQHLDTIEAEIRQQYEKKDMNNAMKMRSTKDSLIQQLQDQNRKLQKQNDLLSRKMQRLQLDREDLQIKMDEKQAEFKDAMARKLSQFEDKMKFYDEQILRTTRQLQQSQQRQKQLNKRVKDAQYLKQQHQRIFREETQNIVSSKQEYLLNEIMMMKKQFQTDMAQITTLYNNKQSENLGTIRSLQSQIDEMLRQIQQDKLSYQVMVEQTNLSKVAANKLKKQNQCLVTDMTRMNEELYQHWLALKDIKTLSTRLQLFGKFMRIYDDLAFNDHLFG